VTDPIKPSSKPKPLPPQAPGAPGWKEKPKSGAAGGFAALVLAAGLMFALLPSEARKLTPYKDSAGIWTVCMGLIGPVVKRHWGTDWTVEECKEAELDYLRPMIGEMVKCVPEKVRNEMSYGQWVSLGHWYYNTGAFCRSGVGRYLAQGDHVRSCQAMGQWTFITVKGRKVNCKDPKNRCSGLATRRLNEVSWCLSAL
jgi:GH24 family phage-related lysozyme (muramidase)